MLETLTGKRSSIRGGAQDSFPSLSACKGRSVFPVGKLETSCLQPKTELHLSINLMFFTLFC